MVAAPDLGSGAERHGGSSPFARTFITGCIGSGLKLKSNLFYSAFKDAGLSLSNGQGINLVKYYNMNITQERIDELNAVLKVKISPDDYKAPVDDALRKYSKKVSMPGFRPGMVPINLIRKMYGKALLADELNKLVADSVDKYISENKLEILGNPLPKAENDIAIDWEKPNDFEFLFDLGLSPQFTLSLPPSHSFPYYEIEIADADMQSEMDRMQRRHGDYTNPEVSDAACSLYGSFSELEDGVVKENGHTNQSFLLIEKVIDTATRDQLTGKKTGDIVSFNPMNAFQNKEDVKYLLGIKSEGEEQLDKVWQFTIERINKVLPAELNQDFYNKVYGEGAVSSEEEFRNKVKAEIAQSYQYESEHKLKHDIEDYFISELKMALPDEFLKRWIKHSNAKITDDQLANEYNTYSRDLKWRMVENRIFKEQNMTIENEDIDNYAKHYILDQYVRYGQAHLLTDEKLKEMSDKFLQNSDNIQRTVENITSRKVFEYLNGILKKDIKKMSYNDFMQVLKDHVH